ncbi:C2 family cysteine protease [Streptomyces sp. NPDC021020]|uniref:C2 family cysteine protease n=1 Tax=Streptomyces sp. NPDC021020 TaxID=3365109 RepID=UPI0037B12B33
MSPGSAGDTGTGFHGFDTPQIRTMAGHMKTISPQAFGMHQNLTSLLQEVQGLMKGKPATTNHLLQPLVHQVLSSAYRGVPFALRTQLDTTSMSLYRRCDHLDAVASLDQTGYTIDPGLEFADEPPPDRAKIDASLGYFDDHIGDPDASQEILSDFGDLTPAELDAVMSRMTDTQLQQLNAEIGKPPTPPDDDSANQQWEYLLLSTCGPETLARLQSQLTNLRWEPKPAPQDVGDTEYEPVDLPLFDGPADPATQMQMGGVGDCWFMASLAAVTEQDPDFPRNHIRQNANGTYTVTIYDESGMAHLVTVDNKLPSQDGSTVYTHAEDTGVLWPAIYEKAYAQYKGGYGNIEGGWGDQGMNAVTGQKAERHSPQDVSLDDVQKRLAKGEAVTVGTTSRASKDPRMVGDHEYTVQSVNTKAHPPTVTVMNPWGAGAGKQHIVTLTQDEYRALCDEVSFTPQEV